MTLFSFTLVYFSFAVSTLNALSLDYYLIAKFSFSLLIIIGFIAFHSTMVETEIIHLNVMLNKTIKDGQCQTHCPLFTLDR